ncbi:hypothetical protein JCM15519_09210 [Fundidesulfovibrio butyratiphilus]
MKRAAVLLVAWVLVLVAGLQTLAQPPEEKPHEDPPPQGRRFALHIPDQYAIPAPPALAADFPKGIPLRMGYGLSFFVSEADGSLLLYGLTGRGPTLPGPWVARGGRQVPLPSRIFIQPQYSPALTALRLTDKSASFVGLWPLRDESGKPLRALPPGVSGPGLFQPLDVGLKRLGYDPGGVFPGGVAKDARRNCLWVSDDYAPALFKVSPGDGRILRRYVPGDGVLGELPGDSPTVPVSGLCVSDSGKVYACLHRPLRLNGVSAQFARLVEFNPENDLVRHFAYPLDKQEYESLDLVRVSDLCFVEENRFLVLEQGPGKNGWISRVFMADISRATNIRRAVDDQDRPVEVVGSSKDWDALGLRMARKVLVLDLAAAGMTAERPMSMSLLPGRTTLAVLSRGAWGVRTVLENPAKTSSGQPLTDLEDYVLQPDNSLSVFGRSTQTKLRVTAGKPMESGLWIFTLPKDPSDYKVTWHGGMPAPPMGGVPAKPAEPPKPPPAHH